MHTQVIGLSSTVGGPRNFAQGGGWAGARSQKFLELFKSQITSYCTTLLNKQCTACDAQLAGTL